MPAETRTPKPPLPTALADPDVMAAVLPYLRRGHAATVAEDRTAERDELARPVHRMVARFIAQAAAYAGEPDPVD
jgi:hypothetical protein